MVTVTVVTVVAVVTVIAVVTAVPVGGDSVDNGRIFLLACASRSRVQGATHVYNFGSHFFKTLLTNPLYGLFAYQKKKKTESFSEPKVKAKSLVQYPKKACPAKSQGHNLGLVSHCFYCTRLTVG
jgi:hypothetical protein